MVRERGSKLLGSAVVSMSLLAMLVAACDGEHNERGDSGGPAALGGKAGAGGSSGGAAGSKNTSGAAGKPSGGGGSNAGACQREPDRSPTVPAPTELDPDLVARAAAVIGSCMPDDGVARNAAHIWLEHLSAPRMYFRHGAQLDCFANANCGCDAIEQCLRWVYSAPPATCEGGCDGDVFKGCGDEVQVTVDCGLLGLSCDPDANCVPATAEPCSDSVEPSCTADGEISFCDDGFTREAPCQSLGFTCAEGKCIGEGATCTDDSGFDEAVVLSGVSCAGDTLTACVGGHTTAVDCTKQGPGFSCQIKGDISFCGLAAECIPADNYAAPEPPTCDGTVLTFCSAGRLEHIDCTQLGFTGCTIDRPNNAWGCTPGPALE